MVSLLAEGEVHAFARVTARESVLVAFNEGAGAATARVHLSGSGIADGAPLEDRLGNAPMVRGRDGTAEIHLAAHSAAIYCLVPPANFQ
jgi:hypothetical protein